MSRDIFSEIEDQLRPDPQVRAHLFEALDAERAAPPPAAPRTGHRLGWVAAAVAVVIVGLAVVPTLVSDNRNLYEPPVSQPPASRNAIDPGGFTHPFRAAIDPDDYARTYAAVQEAFAAFPQGEYLFSTGFAADGAQVSGLQLADAATTTEGGTWATNTQVDGIDEGDIVKSDGHTIFAVSGNDVVLVSAEGAETTEVARIDTTAEETGPSAGTAQGPVIDLMLHGHQLVVLVTEYTPRLSELPPSQSMPYVPYDASTTKALLYDVTHPSSPRFVTSLGQSGAYTASRLAGDLLYLVTRYDVADRDAVDPEDPTTFVPSITDTQGVTPVAADDLTLPADPTGPAFQVISSIDLSTGQRLDTAALMGRADITYMSPDNLFLASTTYQTAATSDFTLDQDTGLRDITQTTDLTQVELADGALTVTASASIPGIPLNQFALDHFDGHLRVAVTMDGTTDSGSWATYPTLFVLDDALNIVASLPQLAVNEQIHSVRFQGPQAYVVTYRQVDPLFTLDLSTPTQPEVMSALKIPGFSTYLHPWAEGRLLGLGMDTSEDGQVHGMKLSMFDTSDPYDVTEATTIKVPFHHAEALHNHKAVFVDPERGLIGFVVETYDTGKANADYLLYHYDDETGFTLLGELPVQQSTTNHTATARAITIDADLYVVAPAGIDVYQTNSLTRIASHRFLDD